MIPFAPVYYITPPLLDRIKQIAILVHELNQRAVPDVILVPMQSEAQAVSTYASTSIEGNPLPQFRRRLFEQPPAKLRQSEQEVVNYNRVLSDLNPKLNAPVTAELVHQIQAGIMAELLRVQKQLSLTQLTPATRLQAYHQQILDTIDQYGFITDKDYSERTDRAKAIRTADFNKLIGLRLIERKGRGRRTHYRRPEK